MKNSIIVFIVLLTSFTVLFISLNSFLVPQSSNKIINYTIPLQDTTLKINQTASEINNKIGGLQASSSLTDFMMVAFSSIIVVLIFVGQLLLSLASSIISIITLPFNLIIDIANQLPTNLRPIAIVIIGVMQVLKTGISIAFLVYITLTVIEILGGRKI